MKPGSQEVPEEGFFDSTIQEVEPAAKRMKTNSEEPTSSKKLNHAILKELKESVWVPSTLAGVIKYGDDDFTVDSDTLLALDAPPPDKKQDSYTKMNSFDWDKMFEPSAKHTAAQALDQAYTRDPFHKYCIHPPLPTPRPRSVLGDRWMGSTPPPLQQRASRVEGGTQILHSLQMKQDLFF